MANGGGGFANDRAGRDEAPSAADDRAATARRIELLDRRGRELEDALVRLTGEHDALVARTRSLVERDMIELDRQIAAFEAAIAANQASVFWRVKNRLAKLVSRAPRRSAP
jgi:hypothetical protein